MMNLLLGFCFFLSSVQFPQTNPSCKKETKPVYGKADTRNQSLRIPKETVPLIDHWMRDTWMDLGPDGCYYMTGTTAAPYRVFDGEKHCWDWNDGLYLWKSKDLKLWTKVGLVWALDKDATWQKEPKVFKKGQKHQRKSINGDILDNKFRAVWAPELHYIKSAKNWFMVACLNQSANGKGSFILRSTSGRPEGPYVNIKDNENGPLFPNIDGSLFEDTNGTVYFIGHNHFIAKMKPDMSGLAEEVVRLKETAYRPEPYIEGAFIFKYDDKYHLVQAVWSHRTKEGDMYTPHKNLTSNKTRYSYDCVISTADNIYGPYSERYTAITGGGHNNLFQDKDGQWWATIFFNPRGAQAKEYPKTCRPGIIPMTYLKGQFKPKTSNTNKK